MPHDLHVVLFEPEIPQNTGAIGRTCLAVGATLHLIEPLGFEITESRLRRAGLDYWEHLTVVRHKNFDAFLASIPKDAPMALFTKMAGHTLFEHKFRPGTYLVFGRETTGLPDYILNRFAADCLRIPMYDARVRSLNLANAASVCLYEAIRQLGA